MAAENQLITFEGKPFQLPKGFEWCVHRYATPFRMRRLSELKFKDFNQCVHKWRNKEFHLFELRRGDMKIMAYCVINQII